MTNENDLASPLKNLNKPIDPLTWAIENRDKLVDQYISEYGNILDPNYARYLFEPIGYKGINVEEYRNGERWLVEQIYFEMLKRNPDANVSFVMGIPGAGKSILVNRFSSSDNIIFDSVLSGDGKLDKYIDMAADRRVEIIFVHADPKEAFSGTIDRGIATSGRLVPIPYMANVGKKYVHIIDLLRQKYGYSIGIINFIRNGNKIDVVPLEYSEFVNDTVIQDEPL